MDRSLCMNLVIVLIVPVTVLPLSFAMAMLATDCGPARHGTARSCAVQFGAVRCCVIVRM